MHHPSLCLRLPQSPLHVSVSLLFMEVIGLGFTPNPGGSHGKILNDTCMNPAFSSSEVLNRQEFCRDTVQPIPEVLEVDLWLGNWRRGVFSGRQTCPALCVELSGSFAVRRRHSSWGSHLRREWEQEGAELRGAPRKSPPLGPGLSQLGGAGRASLVVGCLLPWEGCALGCGPLFH